MYFQVEKNWNCYCRMRSLAVTAMNRVPLVKGIPSAIQK